MQNIVTSYWTLVAVVLVAEIVVDILLIESLRLRDTIIYNEIGSPGHIHTFNKINFAWFFVATGKFKNYEFSPVSTKLFKISRFLLLTFLILFVGWFLLMLLLSLVES